MAVTNVIVLLGTRNLQMEAVKVGCFLLSVTSFLILSVTTWMAVMNVIVLLGTRNLQMEAVKVGCFLLRGCKRMYW
jgi:hypothetical protein